MQAPFPLSGVISREFLQREPDFCREKAAAMLRRDARAEACYWDLCFTRGDEPRDRDRPNEVFAQISESRVGRCIRTARYTYSVYAPGVNGFAAPASDVYADDFLYDMEQDPWQLGSAADDPAYARVKAELRERLPDQIERAEGTRPLITDE